MRRLLALGTLATVAVASVLGAAMTFSPVGVAAPSSCNLNSNSCVGYRWGGLTRQPGVLPTTKNVSAGAIAFSTDLSKRWMGQLEWDVMGEHCTVFPTKPIPIARTNARHEWRVVAGHISITQTYTSPAFARANLPDVVVWHMTGTLVGNKASGTIRWSFAGPNKNACTPSSGSFTWHATLRGKVGNA